MKFIPATICQYTGLKDSSGNKNLGKWYSYEKSRSEWFIQIVFGEFDVINTDNLKVVTKVIAGIAEY